MFVWLLCFTGLLYSLYLYLSFQLHFASFFYMFLSQIFEYYSLLL